MLNPATVNLTVWRGGTYDTKIQFWKDKAHTEPYEITGNIVTLSIEGGPSLAEGGFGITVVGNEIAIKLTSAQTEILGNLARAHFAIKFVKGEEVQYPIHGTMSFESP